MGLIASLNRSRSLGVEHEFAAVLVGHGSGMDVQNVIASVLGANDLTALARAYSKQPFTTDLAVEYDSSVQGTSEWRGVTHLPIELKTRVLNYDEYERIVPKALKIAQYMGGRANHTSMGFHVHIGLPEFKTDPRVVRSLWNACHRYQNVILACQPPSRRGNDYCRPLPSAGRTLHGANSRRSIQRVLSQFSRYHWVNFQGIWDVEPHVEFRVFAATLDPHRAAMTVRFCLQMVEHAVTRRCQGAEEPIANDRRGIDALLVGSGLKVNSRVYAKVSPELREVGRWLLRRWKHWNPDPARPQNSSRKSPSSTDRLAAVGEEG